MPKKSPAVTAIKKEEFRHDQWWYPQRCEKPGCSETSKDVLKKCSGCNMVTYCCKEHQAEDWKEHKGECKLLRKLNLRSTFYTDKDMLARFPLRPCGERNRHCDAVICPPGSRCALCGKKDREEDMTRTDCCDQVVCNDSHNYEVMSFSRDYCQRSHDRYTLCGCSQRHLNNDPDDTADMLWRGLNSYNFCPLLSKDVPRHARCETCVKCSKKFMFGVQGGSVEVGGRKCLDCSMMGMQGLGTSQMPTFRVDHATFAGL